MSPHPHPNINQPPPSICNENTMDMAFLVKLRQFNKCGSVRNDEIINLHLGSGAQKRMICVCLYALLSCLHTSMLSSDIKCANRQNIRK